MAREAGSEHPGSRTVSTGALATAIELLGSMRYAVALLTVLCIASVIGTVLPQGQLRAVYVGQFGPLWTDVFTGLRLHQVYGSWWYLSILGFLILSTSLCVAKTTPKLFREARGWKEHLREQSFRAFKLRDIVLANRDSEGLQRVAVAVLRSSGYACRSVEQPSGTLITAKKGVGNRWGFVLAHVGLVLIGIGAVVDGSLPVRVQMWIGGKRQAMTDAELGSADLANMVSQRNPAFRGSMFVPEGREAGQALLPLDEGFLVQDLPFRLHLNQFRVEYYSSGMPRLFASDVTFIDKRTGKATAATIEVNKPYEMSGVTIYQSSFEDGGSQLSLRAIPTDFSGAVTDLAGVAGGQVKVRLAKSGEDATVELTEFKAVNVEPMPVEGAAPGGKTDKWARLVGAAGTGPRQQTMRNIGATLTYIVRDSAGQATEFLTVHRPMKVDGNDVFLFGVRKPGGSGFEFVRIPADDNGELEQWLLLRRAFMDAGLRQRAVDSYLGANTKLDETARSRLNEAAARVLKVFAGEEGRGTPGARGFAALTRHLEESVPEAERIKMAEALAKLLQGTTLSLWNVVRKEAGLAPAPPDERSLRFVSLSLTALSDFSFVDTPFLLSLGSYREVKASIFQVARAPGKYVVLLGAIGLTAGILFMFYLRSRRMFIWIPKSSKDGTEVRAVSIAMSTSRQSWDISHEFEKLQRRLHAAMG